MVHLADIKFGKLICGVNWQVFSLATRAIQDTDECRQCVHLIWWMKTNLPSRQIKITIKYTTYTVCINWKFLWKRVILHVIIINHQHLVYEVICHHSMTKIILCSRFVMILFYIIISIVLLKRVPAYTLKKLINGV